MSYISEYIGKLNTYNRKALSIFLTAGFPDKYNFSDLAKNVLDAGADMIELGIPFSDPLADGPVIQASSKIALDNGVNIKDVFKFSESINAYSDKPVILMGYANPIRKYGISNFFRDASDSGVQGLIVPDIPLDEYDSFYNDNSINLDIILLATPTSSNERIEKIDARSNGFVYCVSVAGTTGIKNSFDRNTSDNLRKTYSLLKKNKLLIGFGISKPEDVANFSPFCDGVIVGSRVIKSILDNDERITTLALIAELNEACNITNNQSN